MPRKGEHKDLKGMKFNRLYTLEFSHMNGRRTIWTCKCDCGNIVKVESSHLQSGHTKSCGCLLRENAHHINFKTGLSTTKLYYAYRNMRNRCYYKKGNMFHCYGERGITVCEEWLNKDNGFEIFSKWAFENGYNENLTLDRKDNDKAYSPDNCRWVDMFVQANNKRNNRYVKINGEIGTVGNMARKYDVDYWNLLHYSKGNTNRMYPNLKIEVANEL